MTKGAHKGPPIMSPRCYQPGAPASFEVPFNLIKAADYGGVYNSRLIGLQSHYFPQRLRFIPGSSKVYDTTQKRFFSAYGYIPDYASTVTFALLCEPRYINELVFELFQGGTTLGTESFDVDGRPSGYQSNLGLADRPMVTLSTTKDLDSNGAYSDMEVWVDDSGSVSTIYPLIALMWWNP